MCGIRTIWAVVASTAAAASSIAATRSSGACVPCRRCDIPAPGAVQRRDAAPRIRLWSGRPSGVRGCLVRRCGLELSRARDRTPRRSVPPRHRRGWLAVFAARFRATVRHLCGLRSISRTAASADCARSRLFLLIMPELQTASTSLPTHFGCYPGIECLLEGEFVVLVDVADLHVRPVEVGDSEAEERPPLDQSVDGPLLDPFDAWLVNAGVADCVHRYPSVTDAAGVLDTGVGLVDHTLVFVAPEPCADPAGVQQGRQLVAQ